MRVLLEVSSGPDTGRKVGLGAGQELRFGRTEWADFSVPQDGQMSGVHFALETDAAHCYIKDLGSSNGTFVNGRQITAKTVLNNGDEILAGETSFVVCIEGETPAEAILPATEAPGAGVPSVPLPTPAAGGQLTYAAEECSSGLTLCRGDVAEIPPEDLATMLCQIEPVYLIVDFKHLGSPPPEELQSPDYLFDWLDADTAAMVSPVVLAQTDFLGWPDLVKEGWGSDAVVCLYSKQEKPALLEHLRYVIRAKPKREDLSGGMVGYCWPNVMGMLLAHNTPKFVGQLLTGIDAVLVELPDLPETWQLYGGKQICGMLDQLGFVHKPPESVVAGPSENGT